MPGKQVVIHAKTDRPQILNQEHRRSPRVAFTERMDLPKIRHKLGHMGDKPVLRQSLVTEIALLLQVIIHSPLQILPIQIADTVTVKHPLLLRNIIPAHLSCMLENACKNPAVYSHISLGTEIKRMRRKHLGDIRGHLVRFLLPVLIRFPARLRQVIGINQAAGFIDGNLPLDMPACRVLQVIGRGQAVHRLQPDGCTPSVCPLLPAGFPLLHVFIKIHRHNASISQAKLTHFPRKNKPATAAGSSLHFFIYRHAFPGKHVLLARKSPPMTYNPASFFKANNSASLIFSRSDLS